MMKWGVLSVLGAFGLYLAIKIISFIHAKWIVPDRHEWLLAVEEYWKMPSEIVKDIKKIKGNKYDFGLEDLAVDNLTLLEQEGLLESTQQVYANKEDGGEVVDVITVYQLTQDGFHKKKIQEKIHQAMSGENTQ